MLPVRTPSALPVRTPRTAVPHAFALARPHGSALSFGAAPVTHAPRVSARAGPPIPVRSSGSGGRKPAVARISPVAAFVIN
ncbi:hypothetical protein Aca07nite_04790 [Actinoplanes capillaceus]|uniref:Uncharacterized protein n=1 Tax=Actinoplanes campanulatus TaxID=113559 RepID=A0ABQ3W840_9ACTN|nr:hypothetical protein Aca07nite_04790 [Actinoplanes capillaceus]